MICAELISKSVAALRAMSAISTMFRKNILPIKQRELFLLTLILISMNMRKNFLFVATMLFSMALLSGCNFSSGVNINNNDSQENQEATEEEKSEVEKAIEASDFPWYFPEEAKNEGLAEGQTVVVVSDAGMPVINDPGLAVVRRAIERELPVTCAPGPSAVLDALALSGLATDRFCYEGFVPRKNSERIKRFRSLLYEPRTMIFFETPHRIEQTMTALAEIFPTNRSMALCRELTKNYEQIRRGTISGIKQSVEEDPPRGEIVLVIAGAEKVADWDAESKADKVPEIPRRDETSETFETG